MRSTHRPKMAVTIFQSRLLFSPLRDINVNQVGFNVIKLSTQVTPSGLAGVANLLEHSVNPRAGMNPVVCPLNGNMSFKFITLRLDFHNIFLVLSVEMGLKYSFQKAGKIIKDSGSGDLKALEGICLEIRQAEDQLLNKAINVLKRCENNCEGICCRNVQIDAIIGLPDFLYLLIMDSSKGDIISKCLENENIFFTSDCIFLENGKGPCVFPSNSRPEVCITTFCGDETEIKKEIKLVKSKFMKLDWFILLRKPRMLKNFLWRIFNRSVGGT